MRKGLRFVVAAWALFPLAAGAADAPEKLTIAKVAAEKHLWPDKVASTKTLRFQGSTLVAGQALPLYQVDGDQVLLVKPGDPLMYHVAAADTDLLARAAELRKKLTPEQRALDFKALAARPDLWPAEITYRGSATYPNGNKYADGDKLMLISFEAENEQVWFGKAGYTSTNHVWAERTDLYALARANLALPADKRVPRLTRLLQGKLLPAAKPVGGAKPTDPAPGAKHYVLLALASDTEDAAKTIMDVARFYGPIRGKHPEVEVVMFGLDRAMSEKKVPWRVVDPKHTGGLFWLTNQIRDNTRFAKVGVYDAHGILRPDHEAADIPALLANFAKSLGAAADAK